MANIKQFNKLIETNSSVDYCINTFVAEYDIKSAHATALRFIKSEELYNELMLMEKQDRNSRIGCMIRDDQTLHDKIAKLILSWFNKFCEINNIKETNFISSTRDSLLLVNRRPIKTTLENGKVIFRNKDGEFTSYIRINNLEVLFDGMSGNFRIKGISKEYVEGNPAFVRLYKQLLSLIESSKNLTTQQILKKANLLRNKYIHSNDPTVWKSIFDGNKYVYMIEGERVLSDELLTNPEATLVKVDNYIKLFLPTSNILFKPH